MTNSINYISLNILYQLQIDERSKICKISQCLNTATKDNCPEDTFLKAFSKIKPEWVQIWNCIYRENWFKSTRTGSNYNLPVP